MDIQIKKASKTNKKIIENLLQLYLSDISTYFPMDMDQKTGKYIYDDINKYFDKDNCDSAYIIKYENKISGFMFIDKKDDEYVVQEIFILNEYKRKGIGEEVIKRIFDKNRGNWLIKALPCSLPAEKFWTRVVEKYTNGNYEFERIGRFNRAVYRFNNEK